MKRVQDDAPAITNAEQEWIEKNSAEQARRYDKIVENMEALSEQRDAWIDGFLERLQTRGFNYNGDFRRKIEADELPEKPKRPFKVVF